MRLVVKQWLEAGCYAEATCAVATIRLAVNIILCYLNISMSGACAGSVMAPRTYVCTLYLYISSVVAPRTHVCTLYLYISGVVA